MDDDCKYLSIFETKLSKYIMEHSDEQVVIKVNDVGLLCLEDSPNLMICSDGKYLYKYRNIPVIHISGYDFGDDNFELTTTKKEREAKK